MKKVGMVSLGCPKNAVDTEFVLGDLVDQGYQLTPREADAEVLIVNTCGFIESAKRESIDAILDMARLKTEGKCQRLIVTGCLAERYPDDLLREIPEIDHLLGVNQYPRLKHLLAATPAAEEIPRRRNYADAPAEFFDPEAPRVATTPFYTAYLKIAEGCSNPCAFCSIPQMRGGFRSRPLEALVREARNLARRGVRELNLVSQDTTLYGVDLRMKDGLTRLLRSLAGLEGLDWLRLLYCYPTFIGPGLLDFIASEERVCNYIDVPLQHSHDEVLKRMKRQERESGVRRMVDSIRTKIPDAALRTTFITGFPGETEAHFRHLAEFVREMEFDHVGVFVYSDEEGTAAADYSGKVPRRVAEERRDELMRLQRDISRRKNEARVGQVLPVLVEGVDPEEGYLVTGRLPYQAPEIDGQVLIEQSEVEAGQLIPMRITGASDYDLIASAADDAGVPAD